MRKKKKYDDDDGRTIADMNVEGMPWYTPKSKRKVNDEDKPTKKERRAMMRAWFSVYLPRLLIILLSFTVVALMLYLWLNGWKIS